MQDVKKKRNYHLVWTCQWSRVPKSCQHILDSSYSTLPDIEKYVFLALPGFKFVMEIHENFLQKKKKKKNLRVLVSGTKFYQGFVKIHPLTRLNMLDNFQENIANHKGIKLCKVEITKKRRRHCLKCERCRWPPIIGQYLSYKLPWNLWLWWAKICSWSAWDLLRCLPGLNAHTFTSKWQLPYLSQQQEENGHSMKSVMLINFKMPAVVGILEFIRRANNTVYCSEQLQQVFQLYVYEVCKFHVQMSWAWNKFYEHGARVWDDTFMFLYMYMVRSPTDLKLVSPFLINLCCQPMN